MKEEIIKINLKTKIISLKILKFEEDIDIDSILKIAYHNIIGEILTFPVLMNKIGNLQAEMDEILEETKLEFEIKKADLEAFYRKDLIKKVKDGKDKDGNDKEKVVYPTIGEIDTAVIQDAVYQNLQKKIIRINKEKKIIDSFFWSAKSKDDKLNKISDKLRPEEFENDIIEDTLNGIQIKINEKLIK